jgi:formiminoglutamase
MSEPSSNAAAWSSLLVPVRLPADLPQRPDDPRLGEILESWRGDPTALTPGRAVLVGFPQDEGVRRNGGRVGAALAPAEIRRWLWRLTSWDASSGADLTQHPPLDLGDVGITGGLEQSQAALAEVVAAALEAGAVPVVLGGGHETAYGHYRGYVQAKRPVGIINLDAHLDVRPLLDGRGHSGSPFRQALEDRDAPLPGSRYACLGYQPFSTSRTHWEYAHERGCILHDAETCRAKLEELFRQTCERFATDKCQVYVTLDADVVEMAAMPGVSAPNPLGLPAALLARVARFAGTTPAVASFDLVEINPAVERDGQSARWAALAVWQFLVGVVSRRRDGG